MRGPAAEACEQPAGVQLGPPRGPRGQDPPLVQLRQLAPHGGGPGQAAFRARPACRLRQGTDPCSVLGIRMFLGRQDPDPLVRGTDPAPGSFLFLKYCLQNRILTQHSSRIDFLRLKVMCLWVSYKKKIWKKNIIFFASLKSLKRGVESGSISQRCGSGSAPKCSGSPGPMNLFYFICIFLIVPCPHTWVSSHMN